MDERIEFETPENVLVMYRPAGLGSRFIAVLLDSILLAVVLLVLFFLALMVSALSPAFTDWAEKRLDGVGRRQGEEIVLYVWGIVILVWGVGGFLYFGLAEYLMQGQTLGKRALAIRVAKLNGFALDAPSILIRNAFRVVENLLFPPLWLVPLLSRNSQRLGDMVAGTVVVRDEPAKMSGLRERLLQRPAAEALFRFDPAMLKQMRAGDFEAAERILERWADLPPPSREELIQKICVPLAKRLNQEPPEPAQRLRFIEDLLAAELRRQHRHLG